MGFFSNISKVFTLQVIRKHVGSCTKYIVMPITIVLDLLRTFTDVAGPIAFSKAAELLTEKNNSIKSPHTMTPTFLLYLTVGMYAYSRFQPFLIKLIVVHSRNEMTKNIAISLVKKTHVISYADSIIYKDKLENAFQYTRDIAELIPTVTSNLYQPLFSITAGFGITYYNFGPAISTSILAYTVLRTFSGLAAYFLFGMGMKFAKMNNKFEFFLNNQKVNFTNIDIIKLFNHENLELQISKILGKDYFKYYKKTYNSDAGAYISTGFLPLLADLAAVVVFLHFGKNKIINIDLDELIFLLTFLSTVNNNSMRFIESLFRAFRLTTQYDKIAEVLELPEEDHSNETSDAMWLSKALSSGPTIKFDNVSFKYKSTDPTFVLKNVSFTLEPGLHYAIVGNSGSGKSTIVKLLLRLYKPTSGTITINDRDINTIAVNELYKVIGLLSQEIHLFENETVHFNVLYGLAGNQYTRKLISNSSRLTSVAETDIVIKDLVDSDITETSSFLDEDIENNLPHELEGDSDEEYNLVSEKAAIEDIFSGTFVKELSIGQKQRVSFARLLVRNSSIFVLDEPTSALDGEVEAKIMDVVNKQLPGKTTVAIAHRLNTVVSSNEIIVLDDGQIIQQGTHQELIRDENGKYASLWQAQAPEF